MMKRFFVAIGLFAVAGGSAFAETPSIARYTLDNGLEVVLVPDKRVPKIVTNVVYRVGALNEPAGRAGFAHLFEHLMFSGTDAYPSFDTATSEIGITINAWTGEDATTYYQEGLSSTLPVILSMEADRMANLGRAVSQAELDVQRAVVKNEMRQNIIDKPGNTGWRVIWAALFPKGHPYSKSVIGSVADIDAASLDDVQGFFNTFYLPNNAILVVVGDIDVEKTKAMVADTFGRVPRGVDVPRPEIKPTEPTRARIEMTDRVPAPFVALTFTAPSFGAKENGALAIAAEILGNAEYGLLRDRLVGKGLATYASAGSYPGYLAGRFLLESAGVKGVEAAEIEKELRDGLADFLSKPVDPADVERAKRTLLLADRVAREPLSDLTEAVGEAANMLGRPELAFEDDPDIASATPEEVAAVAKKLLNLADVSTLVVTPGPRGAYPPLLADSTGDGAPFTAAPRPVVDVPQLVAGEPGEVRLPARETATLGADNALKLVHYRMPEAPMAYIAVSGQGGWYNAESGKEGIFSLALSMAPRGAGNRDYATFAKAAKDIGANIGSGSDRLGSYVAMSVPPESFEAGVGLLADAVRKPRFDQAEWDILVSETLDWLARREAELPDVARRGAAQVLFSQKDGQPNVDWSSDSVRSITLAEAKQAYETMFAPSHVTILSVGPMSIDDVKAGLEKGGFGDWVDAVAGYSAKTLPSAELPTKRRVLLLPEPGASQTAIYVARAIPGREEAGRPESIAVMRLLGDDFTSRLNSIIREEKGYSYGVYGDFFDKVGKGSALAIATTVQRDASGPALAEYFNGFDSLVKHPVEQEELNRTITGYQLALAGLGETSSGLFNALADMQGSQLTLEEKIAGMDAMTTLTLEAVRAEAVKLASLDQALIVLAGDPEFVLPQLKEIGITDVEIIDRTQAVAGERALELIGGDITIPVSPMSRRDKPGSTEPAHDCEDDASCVPPAAN
jgi:zinc protease